MFDSHNYDRESFEAAEDFGKHEIHFFEPRLTRQTASLAAGFEAVCSFVNDRLDEPTLQALASAGTRLIVLRSAGYNHVNLEAAERLGLTVLRVPEYSPHAVAEHALALVLTLNRKIHRAHARVREWNFSLEGLVGFDLFGKTVGIIGTGRIGQVAARCFAGLGCKVLAFDAFPDRNFETQSGVLYASLSELYAASDIISLHVPLTPTTKHLIDAESMAQMKPGVMLINTGRGALIDSRALITALKSGRLGAAGLDVYEEEEGIFFQDMSGSIVQDDVLARLLTFPNVLVTSHQAYLTKEALGNIAQVTYANLTAFERQEPLLNRVRPSPA